MKKRTEEILVSENCFRQRVNLPAAQVAGLSESELAAALAFEIEPFSGIPQSESEIAWRAESSGIASNRRIFDVIQIRKKDLASILAKAKSEGKKAKGVTAIPDGSVGETTETMPFVAAAKRKSPSSPLTVWLAVCAICFAALFAEWAKIAMENKRLATELGAREILQARKNSLEAKERAIRDEIEKTKGAREKERRSQRKVALLRSSWRILLESVSSACANDCVVQSIVKSGEPFKARLEGMALSPADADGAMNRLTGELKKRGSFWKVSPGEVVSKTASGSVVFSCEMFFDTEGGL